MRESTQSDPTPLAARVVLIAVPLVILGIHAGLYGDWIVDDAAISFAYARNLADGHGLVPQPGADPVEGYSNPLWVLVAAGLLGVGVFDPIWVPKLVSIVLLAIGFGALIESVRRFTPFPAAVPITACIFLAAHPPIVAWAVSGLENGLYLCLLLALFGACLRARASEQGVGSALLAGVLAGAVALTRPEGVLFLAIFPLSIAIVGRASHQERLRRQVGAYTIAALVPLAVYLIVRVIYFGSLVPNTYIAKGGPSWQTLHGFPSFFPSWGARLYGLTASATGELIAPVVIAVIVIVTATERDSSFAGPMRLSLGFLTIAALAFVLLPPDWMPAARFGTGFFGLLATSVAMGGYRLLERNLAPSRKWVGTFVCLMVMSGWVWVSAIRAVELRTRLPIPMSETIETLKRFEAAAQDLAHPDASLMFADIGGPLWEDSLEIIDLGMLCDRRIAEYLGEGSKARDLDAFHEYVFSNRQPTFIATRAYHSWIAKFDLDLRFREQYVPIIEYPDQWILKRYGSEMFSGDYVRREALGSVDVSEIRGLFRNSHYFGCGSCN